MSIPYHIVAKSFAVAIGTAIIMSATITFVFGSKGVISCNEMTLQIEKLQANDAALDRTYAQLNKIKNALERGDQEIISMYARELGFVAKDEQLLRIVGLRGSRQQLPDAGQLITIVRPYTQNALFFAVGLFTGIITFIGSLLFLGQKHFYTMSMQFTKPSRGTRIYQFNHSAH
ncbi:MAG: septum formation initiator family protein [Spirochaetaceae bacterium]|jgi:cell division protein FtsB|nr:septum formation initiator family protein [Spirochaetaceae bacterium]